MSQIETSIGQFDRKDEREESQRLVDEIYELLSDGPDAVLAVLHREQRDRRSRGERDTELLLHFAYRRLISETLQRGCQQAKQTALLPKWETALVLSEVFQRPLDKAIRSQIQSSEDLDPFISIFSALRQNETVNAKILRFAFQLLNGLEGKISSLQVPEASDGRPEAVLLAALAQGHGTAAEAVRYLREDMPTPEDRGLAVYLAVRTLTKTTLEGLPDRVKQWEAVFDLVRQLNGQHGLVRHVETAVRQAIETGLSASEPSTRLKAAWGSMKDENHRRFAFALLKMIDDQRRARERGRLAAG